MSIREATTEFPSGGYAGRRAALLVGASLASLITALAANPARSQSVGALMAASHQAATITAAAAARAAPVSSASSGSRMATAAANALRYQTQLGSAVSLAKAAQEAARTSVAKLDQNQLARVVDGLTHGCVSSSAACGLDPAVFQITPASADPTGVKTWQGANLPTADAANPNQVTVVQTQKNAVLSWSSFNVGEHTTLTFQQTSAGVAQPGWVVLNRVVGVLDPLTGLPRAGSAPAPSQILGKIRAPGTVLVLNQNGILFGPTSQVDVGSLVATSLEIGRASETQSSGVRSLAQRNAEFLDFGILGYAQANPNPSTPISTFSAQVIGRDAFGNFDYDASGMVDVQAGASLTSADHGYLMLLGPKVVNSGALTTADGEVALQSGGLITLTASTGTANSVDPDVRGLVVSGNSAGISAAVDSVVVDPNAIIQSPRGYVSLGATSVGSVTHAGVIASTTSVSENGYVNIFGQTVNIGPGAVIAISPDSSTATLPQDATSLSNFKPSRVRIGTYLPGSTDPASGAYTGPSTQAAMIDIGAGSLIYAPGATASIGADAGSTPAPSTTKTPTTGVTVESGAVIDVAGLTDVQVPATRNSIVIDPVKGNELADSPAFRNGFLNGATVYLDPRLSGVNANGVAWVGSPLIAAGAYAQQVGESVSELMIKGGTVTLGVSSAPSGSTVAQAPKIDIKAGATVDISGGWKTYQAGLVKETYLIDSNGQVIPISKANPDATYVALYKGYQVDHSRWGVSQAYADPLLTGARFEGAYIEGQDAGALNLSASLSVLDGQLFAGAVAGAEQILNAKPGTAASTLYGDQRRLQAAPSQLASGGYLNIEALGPGQTGGGGDIAFAGAGTYGIGPSSTLSFNADALSAAGLSQISAATSGKISVGADALLTVDPGGVFKAVAGRTITVDGAIVAPAGAISLTTLGGTGLGSVLSAEPLGPGFADLVVNGELNVAGRWVNDLNATAGNLTGSAYLSGGKISLTSAPQQTLYQLTDTSVSVNVDISGSILINPGALLDLSGGGYVTPTGGFNLTAKGGSLSLVDTTNYYAIPDAQSSTTNPKFRLNYNIDTQLDPLPAYMTSRISIADGAIKDAGFGGGGVFSLTAPSFRLLSAGASSVVSPGCGADGTPCGAALATDFFSTSGFAAYNITSKGTALLFNVFDSGLGGYSGLLKTQVAEVKSGQTLSLSQSYFSPVLSTAQVSALQTLQSGSSLYSVLTPSAPTDAWDQKPISLSLGGLMELRVDAGAQVTGAPGAALAVNELYNQGLIRLPGGAITQSETNYQTGNSVGVHTLADVFGPALADGTYSETAINVFFPGGVPAGSTTGPLTNAAVAFNDPINPTPVYFLGDLNAGEAVRLTAGSVTDLSGAAVVNPRAVPRGTFTGGAFTDGSVLSGGAFTANGALNGAPKGVSAQPGAILNLAGVQATFDRSTVLATTTNGSGLGYTPTQVWSDGGSLTLNQGGTITGAAIQAQGGAPLALGGSLNVFNPTLYQIDPSIPTANAISANAVESSGFSTFIAQGTLSSTGDVTLHLRRSLFVENAPTTAGLLATAPTISSGGRLEIDAPYIGLYSQAQAAGSPAVGTVGGGSLILSANAIDVTGAVLLDQSIGSATFSTTGDIRLIGAAPTSASQTASTLIGQLAVNGDLTLNSAQVYASTASDVSISSTGVSSPTASKGGLITFNSVGATPATPYSAGGALTVTGANIVQNGVIRVPLGSLTLGSDTDSTFAPATASVTLRPGSLTSVSADGLNIPYGATTDQVEWYFTPTKSAALAAPPKGVLHLAGGAITTSAGATVDLKGGGDVYAYEFVSGTGGSRDVLDQFNADQFSSNNGYQYPDGRQVYAIVPGLSNAAVAANDPIYSANYGDLYGPSQVGKRVYLDAAPGLTAGWYTLLPAKYALLPGGMRVVQDTGAATPPAASGAASQGSLLADGTIVTSGYFGVAGVDTRSATPVLFDVQKQSIILNESKIALTQGNRYFTALATSKGVAAPQLPIDAGRLILSPVTDLKLSAAFETTPANLAASNGLAALTGRGSQVDISGDSLFIASPTSTVTPPPGSIVLTDASLADLNAASLFLGGTRTDEADGTTSLDVTSNKIVVGPGASLTAPEILLATDGAGARIAIDKGASIIATGAVTGESSGVYVIDGVDADGARVQAAQGGFVRVSNGPERLLERRNIARIGAGSVVVGPRLPAGGPAKLQGASVELNSRGGLSVNTNTIIKATSIDLAASAINFEAKGTGLVLTPDLQAILEHTDNVTLQSQNAIGFSAGTYAFKALALDTPGLKAIKDGAVTLNVAGKLSLSSRSPALSACTDTGALACGAGSLAVSADSLVFGSGTIRVYGAASGVTLAGTKGVFADGAAVFDAGAAPLTINTPFVGDRGTGLAGATQPSLTLVSTGAVAFQSATPASAVSAPGGTPGAHLTVVGNTVSVVGTELRATAGTLSVTGATGVAISGGAVLATPSYARTFGDAVDSTTVSAPGGQLLLTAQAGDVAISDDSLLVVGGAKGAAGTLSLTAHSGSVFAYHGTPASTFSLASTFSAQGGGGGLTLDTGGAFDLAGFAGGSGKLFNGVIAVRTGAGDLSLTAGQMLKATSVSLTADGGRIDMAGAIDTGGVAGGDVELYGMAGVHLASTALIDAHASGYGATSTQQASGGNVTLGVDGAGAIAVDAGAKIDVSARNPGARLVNLNRTNGTYYTYVAGDAGGTVTFRAPVVTGQGGAETVNVAVNGAVAGAADVVLQGFRHFSLDQLAANPTYVGVSISNGVATLDLAASGTGQINALGDTSGPVAGFVQTFDVSASYAALGGLASQANFHARPGIELDYSGALTLASNWNFGAGVVDVAGAAAAGLMAADAGLPGRYTVVGADAATLAANEAKILADYTQATYRVGGSFFNEAGVLTVRAGGGVTLNGSLTDGFFQFADQTDPAYLNQVLGGGDRVFQANLAPTYDDINKTVSIVFPGCGGLIDPSAVNPSATPTAAVYTLPAAPYSAQANSAAALGDAVVAGGALTTGTGDPLGSARLFPLLTTSSGDRAAVKSWSYQLVAGATSPSANPVTVDPGAAANLIVQGQNVYGYQPSHGVTSYSPSLNLLDSNGASLAASQWLAAFESQNGLGDDAVTTIASTGTVVAGSLKSLVAQFLAANPGDQITIQKNGSLTTTLAEAAKFMSFVSTNFSQFSSFYTPPPEAGIAAAPTYATAPTLVRTGTGNITLAAAGAVDLRNGDQTADPNTGLASEAAQILTDDGRLVAARGEGLQLGGAAVYTAGAVASLGVSKATDVATGLSYDVDLAAHTLAATNNLANQSIVYTLESTGLPTGVAGAYAYGGGNAANGIQSGYAGVLIGDPAYTQAGGNVSLIAGTNVLSRRNTFQETRLGGFGYAFPLTPNGAGGALPSWVGVGDQAWRTGAVGGVVNLQVNPQLFGEGLGALGGGNISVRAGGTVSDISLVASDSIVTADVGGGAKALVNLGGGGVSVIAGGDILGGRLDVAAGDATLQAGGSLSSAGQVYGETAANTFVAIADTLRVRLSDGTVRIAAGGSATVESIGALGIDTTDSFANSKGFYAAGSGVSIHADGAVTVANNGLENGLTLTAFGEGVVYPGSFEAVSFTSNLSLSASATSPSLAQLYPDARGTLTLLAAGNIAPAAIAQLDSDPTQLPGAFSAFTFGANGGTGVTSGIDFGFPSVLPNTSDVTLRLLHNAAITHAGDANPNRIAAGGDITGVILSSAKQARVSATRDIVNMVLLGQNISAGDVTRVAAGRDIIATTELESTVVNGPLLPTVQGNTFVLGGPGALFLEAGRNAGPFLNSAVANARVGGALTGPQAYGGGVITVGNAWNPALSGQGADIYAEFGVANGQNFDGLVANYLTPSAFASQPGYLFLQSTDINGITSADRTHQVYALSLVDWMRSVAPDVIDRYDTAAGLTTPGANAPALIQFLQSLKSGAPATTTQALAYLPQLSSQSMPLIPWLQLHEPSVLTQAYGSLDVTYDQALAAFQALPTLAQRQFLLKNVYFNELIQTSLPASPSYLTYSRGYTAVNTLFPAASGYTANSLGGGPSGASKTVETGNLDLRLSTIQTQQGGDITLLGPGGRILAGSVVSTSAQASRRNYAGASLYQGSYPQPATAVSISAIPPGYEGILTLRGGSIDSFTDRDFLLNQSRAFTEQGGDLAIWSSNADVNAGQGPRTTPDISPAVVHIDENGYSVVDTTAAVSGAGIGAFSADSNGLAPDVFLIAPRGTVDAGAAGVRSSGNVFVAAFQVANADAIHAQGTISGAGTGAAVTVGGQSNGDSAAAAAAQAAQAASGSGGDQITRPFIIVDVLGSLPQEMTTCAVDDDPKKTNC